MAGAAAGAFMCHIADFALVNAYRNDICCKYELLRSHKKTPTATISTLKNARMQIISNTSFLGWWCLVRALSVIAYLLRSAPQRMAAIAAKYGAPVY